MVLIAFTSFAGIDLERAALSEVLVLALSFAIPFWYVWNEQQKHFKAVVREYSMIQRGEKGLDDSSRASVDRIIGAACDGGRIR
jgi:hypothetical protein